jgi:hypothetical protein
MNAARSKEKGSDAGSSFDSGAIGAIIAGIVAAVAIAAVAAVVHKRRKHGQGTIQKSVSTEGGQVALIATSQLSQPSPPKSSLDISPIVITAAVAIAPAPKRSSSVLLFDELIDGDMLTSEASSELSGEMDSSVAAPVDNETQSLRSTLVPTLTAKRPRNKRGIPPTMPRSTAFPIVVAASPLQREIPFVLPTDNFIEKPRQAPARRIPRSRALRDPNSASGNSSRSASIPSSHDASDASSPGLQTPQWTNGVEKASEYFRSGSRWYF